MAKSSGEGSAHRRITRVGLDSGGYTAYSKGERIDINRLISFIRKYRPLLDVYFALDVICPIKDPYGDTTFEYWLRMVKEGLDPVPVYHYGKSRKYLYQYMRQTDYLAVGGSADASRSERQRQYDELWEKDLLDSTGNPRAKVHAFGLMSPPLLDAYPWYSSDGTAWVDHAKVGNICVPKRIGSSYVYSESPTIVPVSTLSTSRGKHIENLPHSERLPILEYIQERGFRLGKGEYPGEPGYERGLSNDLEMRYQLNAIYFTEMGRELEIITYLAGNIPALQKPDVERSIRQAVYGAGYDCNRFISFAFNPEIKTVINLKKEESDETE